MSRMERMLHDRRHDDLEPVVDEYGHARVNKFSTRFVLIMCLVVLVFVIAMFVPLQTQVMAWVRAGFVVSSLVAVIAILLDRSTHLHRA